MCLFKVDLLLKTVIHGEEVSFQFQIAANIHLNWVLEQELGWEHVFSAHVLKKTFSYFPRILLCPLAIGLSDDLNWLDINEKSPLFFLLHFTTSVVLLYLLSDHRSYNISLETECSRVRISYVLFYSCNIWYLDIWMFIYIAYLLMLTY